MYIIIETKSYAIGLVACKAPDVVRYWYGAFKEKKLSKRQPMSDLLLHRQALSNVDPFGDE